MGNCLSNTGRFEPPGSRSVAAFVEEYDKMAADVRAEIRKASLPAAKPSPRMKCSMCSICTSYVDAIDNPWQQTRDDGFSPKTSDDDDDDDAASITVSDAQSMLAAGRLRRRNKLGLELKPCQHVFCGVCLAGEIYRNLNIPFNPLTYGTILAPSLVAPLGGRMRFPMGCPACTVKPNEDIIEIGDTTARLVLGDGNMDEWNQARFLWTQDIIYLLSDEKRAEACE